MTDADAAGTARDIAIWRHRFGARVWLYVVSRGTTRGPRAGQESRIGAGNHCDVCEIRDYGGDYGIAAYVRQTGGMMRLMERIVLMFRSGASQEPDITERAIASMRAVGDRADELNERLKPYLAADDPFASFVADMYNLGQVGRIYEGPLK